MQNSKASPHYSRPVTFTNLRHIAYDAAHLARQSGRTDAVKALDHLLAAVCGEAEAGAIKAPRPPFLVRLAALARRAHLNLNLNWLGDPLTTWRRGEPMFRPSAPDPADNALPKPADDSDLATLYHEWRTLLNCLNGAGAIAEGPLWDTIFARIGEVERIIGATAAATLHGFAVKIVVADDLGTMNNNEYQLALVAEALAMLGEAA